MKYKSSTGTPPVPALGRYAGNFTPLAPFPAVSHPRNSPVGAACARMPGRTRPLARRAAGGSRLLLLHTGSSVRRGSLGCAQDLRRSVGRRHPHGAARVGALSSRAVAHGSALMEHEVMQSWLGSAGSDLNQCPRFSASQGWAKGAPASFWKPSWDARAPPGLPAAGAYPTVAEHREE